MHNKKISLFVKFGFILFLFPFASPLPLFTDVQPLCFIYAGIYVVMVNAGLLRADLKLFSIVALFALMSFFILNISGEYAINRRIGGVAILVTLIFYLKYLNCLSANFVKKIMELHLSIMILQYISPAIFDTFLSHFIRASTYFEGDNRGVSGLNAEPGGGAAVMFGLFVLHQYLIKYSKSKHNNFENVDNNYKNNTLSVFLYFIAGMLLTHGGVSIVLFMAVIIYFIVDHGYLKYAFLFIIFLIFTGFFLTADLDSFRQYGRGAELIAAFINEGFAIIYTDGSMAERFLGLAYGYNSLKLNLLGVGGGGYSVAALEVENNFNLSNIFYTARPQINDAVSIVGIYLAEYGILFILFMIAVIFITRPKSKSFFIFQFIGVSFIFFSYSFAFPITWLIFVCCYLDRKNYIISKSGV